MTKNSPRRQGIKLDVPFYSKKIKSMLASIRVESVHNPWLGATVQQKRKRVGPMGEGVRAKREDDVSPMARIAYTFQP